MLRAGFFFSSVVLFSFQHLLSLFFFSFRHSLSFSLSNLKLFIPQQSFQKASNRRVREVDGNVFSPFAVSPHSLTYTENTRNTPQTLPLPKRDLLFPNFLLSSSLLENKIQNLKDRET